MTRRDEPCGCDETRRLLRRILELDALRCRLERELAVATLANAEAWEDGARVCSDFHNRRLTIDVRRLNPHR